MKVCARSVGVAAIATSTNTTATLVHDKIVGTAIPTQELSCCGFNAEIISIPPNSFQSVQVKSAQGQQSTDIQEFLKKKFGLEEKFSKSSSAVSPF